MPDLENISKREWRVIIIPWTVTAVKFMFPNTASGMQPTHYMYAFPCIILEKLIMIRNEPKS